MTRGETFFLYGFVSFLAVLFSHLSQQRVWDEETFDYRFRRGYFFLSFICLWFVSVFTNIGVDYDSYTRIIRLSGLTSTWNGEYGFNILCLLSKTVFGENYDACIFGIKTITLMVFFMSLYKLKEKLRISLSMLAFVFLAYFRFYLMSMHIASALILLSVAYLYLGYHKRGIVAYFLAFSMHYSSVFLLPAYVLYFIITKMNRKFSRTEIVLMVFGYAAVFWGTYQIYTFMMANFSIFNQYSQYRQIMNYSGTGIMQIVFYVPILYYCYLGYGNSSDEKNVNLLIVMALTGFLYAMLGYRMEVMSRMYEHFMSLYMIMIPIFLTERASGKELIRENFLFTYRSDIFIWCLCILLRGSDVMNDILKIGSSSQLANWRFFWPF